MPRSLQLVAFTIAASALCAAGLIARVSWSNLDLTLIGNLARPFLVITSFTIIAAALSGLISRRLFVLMPFFVFLLFSFGPVAELTTDPVAGQWIAAAVLAILIGLIIYLTRNFDPLQIARAATALFFVMTAPFSLPIFGLLFQSEPPQVAADFAEYVDAIAPPVNPQSLPDVVYIVPDRYASAATLESDYDLDNSKFYRRLQERGFMFNADATANYPTTAHSMSSTANSGYLAPFAARYGKQTGRLQPLYAAIENSQAQRAMRKLGYRFINAGSWWDASRFNRNADQNYGTDIFAGINRVSLSELEHVLWRGTPLRVLPGFAAVAASETECRRIKRKLKWVGEVGNMSKPVFVLAHMTIPHTPIVADINGNCLAASIDYPAPGITHARLKSAYGDYLRYFNDAILNVFDRQLQRRAGSGRGLLFIIQSDEGPYPETTRLQEKQQNFIDLPAPELANKLGILNAIYLGGAKPADSDALKTPINNWRIILEHITGKPAGRNPHKVHIYKDYQQVHDYVDVTGQFLK